MIRRILPFFRWLMLLSAISTMPAQANHLPEYKVQVLPPVKDCGYSPTMQSNARLDPASFPSFKYDIDLRTKVNDPIYYLLDNYLEFFLGQDPGDRCADFDQWHQMGTAGVVDIACEPGSWVENSDLCTAFNADPALVRSAYLQYNAEAQVQCPERDVNLVFGRHNLDVLLEEVVIADFLDISINVRLDDFVVQHLFQSHGLAGDVIDAWDWWERKQVYEQQGGCSSPPAINCERIWPIEETIFSLAEAEKLADIAFRGLIGFIVADGSDPICAEGEDRGVEMSVGFDNYVPGQYFVLDFGPLAPLPCTPVAPPIGDPICDAISVCTQCAEDKCLTLVEPGGARLFDVCHELGGPYCSDGVMDANLFRILQELIVDDYSPYLCTISTVGVQAGLLEAPICNFDDALMALLEFSDVAP